MENKLEKIKKFMDENFKEKQYVIMIMEDDDNYKVTEKISLKNKAMY